MNLTIESDLNSTGDQSSKVERALAIALAHAERVPFNWADENCCLWVAGYLADLTGCDDRPFWRDRCRDEATARREIEDAGGMLALFRARAAVMGIGEVSGDGRRGDIVVADLVLFGIAGPALPGIDLGDGWTAFRDERSLKRTRRRFPVVGRWRCA